MAAQTWVHAGLNRGRATTYSSGPSFKVQITWKRKHSILNPLEEQRRNAEPESGATGRVGSAFPTAHTCLTHAVNVTLGAVGKPRVSPGLTTACIADAARKSHSASVFPEMAPCFDFVTFITARVPRPRISPCSKIFAPTPTLVLNSRYSHRPHKSRWRQVQKHRCYKYPSPARRQLSGSSSPPTLLRAQHFRPLRRCRPEPR